MKSTVFVFLIALMNSVVWGAGFDENYEVRYGDFDSDGLQDDLYVRQKPKIVILHGEIATPIVIPPDVDEFVLTQDANGDMNVQSSLSSSQRSMALQWPEASIEIVLSDFNIDGVIDILLKGVGNVITGAFDQIVFASSQPNAPPMVVTTVDDDFRQFYEEINSWMANPNYFEDNAPTITQPVTINDTLYRPEYCASSAWVSENGPLDNLASVSTVVGDTLEDVENTFSAFLAACSSTGRDVIHYDFVSVEYQIPSGGKDYSVFHPSSMVFTDLLNNILNVEGIWELIVGSVDATIVIDVLEEILGTEVFGGVIKSGGILDAEADEEVNLDTIAEFRGVVLSVALEETSEHVTTGTGDWRLLTAGEKLLAKQNGITINNVDKVRVYNRGIRAIGIPATSNDVASIKGAYLYRPRSQLIF